MSIKELKSFRIKIKKQGHQLKDNHRLSNSGLHMCTKKTEEILRYSGHCKRNSKKDWKFIYLIVCS